MEGHENAAEILIVGPPATGVGGMVSVVRQMTEHCSNERFNLEHFAATEAHDDQESMFRKIIRHLDRVQSLKRTVEVKNAELVHIHTCSGISFFRSIVDMLAAHRAGCRVVLHVHGAQFEQFFDRAGLGGRLVIRWALAQADAVIALSSRWKTILSAMSPAARIVVIENAVEIAQVPRSQRHRPTIEFLLLARMDIWKGVDDLLDACILLAGKTVPFRMTLAGPDGSAGDARTLNAKICSRGLKNNVRYVGAVYGTDKEQLLRDADVYVQPSHNEGMPIAILEAMASGLPVVATDVGAVSELLTPACGILVPARSAESLARAMSRLATDPALRSSMAKQARDRVAARFSVSRFERDLARLYSKLLPRLRLGQVSNRPANDLQIRESAPTDELSSAPSSSWETSSAPS